MKTPAAHAANSVDAAALRRVREYADAATGRRGAQTTQTRAALAILRELGLSRSQYSVQTVVKRGEYLYALVSPLTLAAGDALAAEASRAAGLGMNVHLYRGRFMAAAVKGGPGAVYEVN